MKKNSKAELTEEQIAWLRLAHETRVHPTLMALHLQLHVDTVKRLLDRHGIMTALSSKHITGDSAMFELWTRPCIRCKADTPRPKNQYICDKCKRTSESSGLPDDFLFD